LEIGPGLRPRLPIAGTHFVDISGPAIERLAARGGIVRQDDIGSLPYANGAFELVGAFDVIEHVADDERIFRELSRVIKAGGHLVFSVPLHRTLWTEFDECVGHVRRYEPVPLVALLERFGFDLERSAGFGMAPRRWVLSRGMRWLRDHRATALRWYNSVFNPIGMLLQKRLKFGPGLIETSRQRGIVLVCLRSGRPVPT
jgi:SAM-dependent methyltransferase